jgi:hypothetical protein
LIPAFHSRLVGVVWRSLLAPLDPFYPSNLLYQSQLQLPTSQSRPLTNHFTLGENPIFLCKHKKRTSKNFRKETSKKPTCFFETLQLNEGLFVKNKSPNANLSICQCLSPLSSPLLWPQQRTALGLLALTASFSELAASKGGLESTHQVGQA